MQTEDRTTSNQRVCPVHPAGGLDFFLRHWLQNPSRMLHPHVKPGMTVLDHGRGPVFFTLVMARLVGPPGRVIDVDLQAGMLDRLRRKIRGSGLEGGITLHQCAADHIGLSAGIDFALAF